MAYARFGSDSDVYVFEIDGPKWDCCQCSIGDWLPGLVNSRSEMIRHLQERMKKGHKVLSYAMDELQVEIETLGDTVAST